MQTSPTPDRTPFIAAAVTAWMTCLYWAALALLIGGAATTGSASPVQVILPFILIGLYGYRGYQVFQGQPAAANSLLILHGLGALISVMRMVNGDSIALTLYGIKIVIHLLGAAAAYWAKGASTRTVI